MIDRVLRRYSVKRRIFGTFLVFAVFIVIAIPLIIANQHFIVSRLQRVTQVETRADRLLLQASGRVMSSRIDLMRFLQDYLPSTQNAISEAEQATVFLLEVEQLLPESEQEVDVSSVLEVLAQYITLINDVQTAHQKGEQYNASRIVFLAFKTGNDIGQRIEYIVRQSEVSVAATNERVYAEAQKRLVVIIAGYTSILLLSFLAA